MQKGRLQQLADKISGAFREASEAAGEAEDAMAELLATVVPVPGGGLQAFVPPTSWAARSGRMRERGQALVVQKRRAANKMAAATRQQQRARARA